MSNLLTIWLLIKFVLKAVWYRLRLLFVLATEHTLLRMLFNIWRQILFRGDLHDAAFQNFCTTECGTFNWPCILQLPARSSDYQWTFTWLQGVSNLIVSKGQFTVSVHLRRISSHSWNHSQTIFSIEIWHQNHGCDYHFTDFFWKNMVASSFCHDRKSAFMHHGLRFKKHFVCFNSKLWAMLWWIIIAKSTILVWSIYFYSVTTE